MTVRRSGGSDGFTLIELLVALALMGMASMLLLQGLRTAGIIAMRERGAASRLEVVIAAQRLLRSTIERVRPVTRLDTAQPIVDLQGSAAVLTFVAPPFDRAAPDALQRFRLTRTASGALVLYSVSTRKARVDRSGIDLVDWTPATLMTGVSSLSISYFGPSITGGARIWQDRWWDRPQPPELVRVRVEFARGDRRVWPDLIVRPRATTAPLCVPDENVIGACGGRT